MDRRNWMQEELNHYAKALVVFLFCVAIALAGFFVLEQRAVESNTKENIADNIERQSHLLRLVLETNYGYLEAAAERVAENEELLAPQNIRRIKAIQENTDLERVGLIDTDGMAVYDNGAQKSVAERRYFQEAIHGQMTLSDPLESMLDGATRVILGVPVRKGDKVIGILSGSFNVTALSQMLFEDVYHGEGMSLLVAADGTVVSSDCSDDGRCIYGIKNFFEFCEQMETPKNQNIENVKADFQMEKSGNLKLWEKDRRAEKLYLNYAPMGVNGWMMCYLVPEAVAQDDYGFIRRYEGYLSITLIVLVVVLLMTLLLISDRQQRQLLRAAQTDALTKTLNKQAAETMIGNWLRRNLRSGRHAFMMLDIDKFKDINDTYGHMVGDAVLRQVGELMRQHFRNDDIIGRIGGDEFVVFMKRIDTKETVTARAEELLQKFRELEVEGVEGGITGSVGLVFAPDHGESYAELYKSADIALYQTKERGRDGYTVF